MVADSEVEFEVRVESEARSSCRKCEKVPWRLRSVFSRELICLYRRTTTSRCAVCHRRCLEAAVKFYFEKIPRTLPKAQPRT